ncbi:MAG: branched-chain amino acid ABC transporter permease [Oscillospiraceae bacterium]|nr:branched-chain amino acid ABC transporter permease [Oscillospiraceae bacterium]
MNILRKIKTRTKVIILALLLAVILFPIVVQGNAFYVSVATEIVILAILAISFDLLLGYTGIVSMGHAMFFGTGAYMTAILMVRYNWNFFATLPFVVLACAFLSIVVGFLTLRVKKIYFAMMTMALGQLFFILVITNRNLTGGEDGLAGVPPLIRDRVTLFFVAVAVLAIVYYVVRRITLSPTGKVLQAIRENEVRTSMIGYNVLLYKIIIITISGVLAGLAGSFFVTYIGVAYAELMHAIMTIQVIFMTVIGGAGTLFGSVIGAFLVRTTSTVLGTFTNRWMLILGIMFVVFIMFLPGGIASIRLKFLKKIGFIQRLGKGKEKSDDASD